ncbi:hypothetical protein N7541_001513 [Penicillium brevicompactum]|uniref:RING-type domain-containing protein n=1 Tax=Penicillium brevicompactum TaxID=5074 RepID=A0A9W9V3P9_PENBR|nr:hypothetical protein N7541_001513 [Penicillium brevicompactum]
MSDNTGVQIVAARSKRTHREMAAGSGDNSDATWYPSSHPSGSSSVHLPQPRDQTTSRYGDDHRRPVMLSPGPENVIDLTEDPESPPQSPPQRVLSASGSRLPIRDIINRDSSEQNVIDLETEGNGAEGTSGDPDVEIIGSTVRPMPTMEPRYFDPNGFAMYHPLRRPNRPFAGLPSPWVNDNFLLRSNTRESSAGHRGRDMPSGIPGSMYGDDFVSLMNNMPAILPYNVPAFEYNSTTQSAPRSRRGAYKAPPPAPKGFARCLEDEHVPICPNCEEELGTGSGRKVEIYVAKACGHAYCGECAENRSISKSKKSSSKTKPFSKCQVEGCNKPVSSQTAMTHLFL